MSPKFISLLACCLVTGLVLNAQSAGTNTAPVVSGATNAPAVASTNSIPAGTNVNPTATAASMETLDDEHKLAARDILSFRIEQDREDPKSLPVTDSGDIEVPYLGRFPAQGKTCKQLAYDIKVNLEKDYYHHATVIIAIDQFSRSRGTISVTGHVRMSGFQDIPSDGTYTVSKAITKAGGLMDFADDRRIKIMRMTGTNPPVKTILFNYRDYLNNSKNTPDLPLQNDDTIIVEKRTFNF